MFVHFFCKCSENVRQKMCLSCAVCKASDSEHEIVMTNKKDFMGRNEELRQIAAD